MSAERLTAAEIVAQAQRTVTAHRTTSIRRRWERMQWLPLGVIAATIVAFFAAPGTLPEKLLLAMRGVCALRPSHSFFMGALQLPLEARTTGSTRAFC